MIENMIKPDVILNVQIQKEKRALKTQQNQRKLKEEIVKTKI